VKKTRKHYCPSREPHQPVESMTWFNFRNVSEANVTSRYMSMNVSRLDFDLYGHPRLAIGVLWHAFNT
jgi:hypothetical protein